MHPSSAHSPRRSIRDPCHTPRGTTCCGTCLLYTSVRARITCIEDPAFTAGYHDPTRRSIPNALTIELTDGTTLPEVVVEFPIGHRLRRAEGIPLLLEKFQRNLARLSPDAQEKILALTTDQAALEAIPVDEFVNLFVV